MIGVIMNSLNEFTKYTGLLDKYITELNIPDIVETDGAYQATDYSLQILQRFVASNPRYHIITAIENDEGTGVTYVNSIRYCNRLLYFLGTGVTTRCQYTDVLYD